MGRGIQFVREVFDQTFLSFLQTNESSKVLASIVLTQFSFRLLSPNPKKLIQHLRRSPLSHPSIPIDISNNPQEQFRFQILDPWLICMKCNL